jgi:hypothetical protein
MTPVPVAIFHPAIIIHIFRITRLVGTEGRRSGMVEGNRDTPCAGAGVATTERERERERGNAVNICGRGGGARRGGGLLQPVIFDLRRVLTLILFNAPRYSFASIFQAT